MDDFSTINAPVALPTIDWDAGGIQTELGWALPATYQGFSRSATGAVADVPGGPRGYQVLVAITTEEPSSQLALAHRLGIDKTQMTYVIDALEAGGFVERRPDPNDRRIRQVHPTGAGRSLLTSARGALREVEGVLMRHLSPDEQTQLRRLLARVALGAGDVEACITDARAAAEHPSQPPRRSH
ncbi:DNA-binding MarR family transcriptional regulator [Microbacterium halimionae]|uniref:DNA-binding MarR family transcriptional regulator n=1 Tax=Microbacterium halimionae TaxID=1526413 RepID=A0A7W3JN16_9MICO|nr:MarR family winged helix-turn-helix transcriptional regulator [Microbacterium halimionae]MBA8815764.1 DNA-binding MarR family transcriptional regulator [Microbacterium halimionae]NII95810.1 DNA-binding MarR family transcriptional regulator [Microbacterium halimionae]